MIGRRLSHYEIERRLGAGGMGEVYLARDLALDRPAAIKLLPDGTEDVLRERLRREAHIVSRLQHPAIATFYEAGEVDGVFFLAMEFVPGETLREALRGGALSTRRALSVASALLEALVHAHAVGVLHRDIKPENVMLTGETAAKLLDFGIAKAFELGGDGAETRRTMGLTRAGSILGTPGYLAPEQAAGELLDPGADVFALAAVLYEMLHARPAFPGATAWDRLQAVRSGRGPVPPRSDLPERLRSLLGRALAFDRTARHRAASDLLAELLDFEESPGESLPPGSLAVLELDFLGGAEENGWIGGAVADTVCAVLSRVPGLEIVPRERAARARAEARSAEDSTDALLAGRRLGSRWILAGSVQAMGDSVRLTPRLLEVATGRSLWTEKLDGIRSDLFALQDRIAESVASALSVRLAEAAPPPRLDAYELCGRAKSLFFRLEKGSFERAHRLLEQALVADSKYAEPYALLCGLHAMRFTFRTDPGELELCRSYAEEAIALAPSLAEPRVYLSYALWRLGDRAGALRQAEEASRLDPREPRAPYFAGCIRWSLHDRDEAKRLLQQSVRLGPDHGFAWMLLGTLCAERGEFDLSRWCLAKAIELEGRGGIGPTAGAGAFLAEVVRREGAHEEARRICRDALETIERSDHMYRDTFRGTALTTLGRIALAAGEPEAAAAAFQQTQAHLDGRRRTLGGGFLAAQAHAGLAQVRHDTGHLDEAERLLGERDEYDHSWLWLVGEEFTLCALALAAERLGAAERGRAWRERARARGYSAAGVEPA